MKCPRCGGGRLKDWKELTDEEKFAAGRLPASAKFTEKERERHRICTKCWYETSDTEQRA
jgi:hypothetical protein